MTLSSVSENKKIKKKSSEANGNEYANSNNVEIVSDMKILKKNKKIRAKSAPFLGRQSGGGA
jgi:hypothetical protein